MTAQDDPKLVPQIMVSSTFTDLQDHRAAIISAIQKYKMHANVMEYDDAKPAGDVIDSSLQMVQESAGYICLIGLKYGQTPVCPERNPRQVSITELEFNEALRLKRPILLFVMDDDHPVTKKDIEKVPEKEKKLNAFRERAKIASPASLVNRVYSVFDSLADFKDKFASSLAELRDHLRTLNSELRTNPIPTPPAFFAKPDYIGRNKFIGREKELQTLSDWAKPSDPTSILLFEAIGGNGKSMLTWEWTNNHAEKARESHKPWAGRFWYSFYEKGAVMRDYCQHALAYMTQQPLVAFEKRSTPDMRVELLALLHKQPWLLILDGLERVLVAYHRIDASEVPDEEVNRPTDKILNRDPCDAIRDEDTDLLRALAAVAPSKILISSRLIPRVLLNQAGIPLPGVKPLELPGLDEADAEALLRSCGVKGASADIRYYLTNYCANHPLVIGVLAGLINSPGPHRGNFDTWASDPEYGAKLNLASLDLIQSRNHILRAALEALEPASRQLLSTLALLSDAVDYDTVAAFNPHTPPEPKKLSVTIEDLEHRGLLSYDGRTQRYDLHPVVRGVAAGGMRTEDKERYGQSVVDYYSSRRHNPFEQAKSLEDVESGLHVVRTLLKLGHYRRAADACSNELLLALLVNLEAHVETLSLLRPFFLAGWDKLPLHLSPFQEGLLADAAGMALLNTRSYDEALAVHGAALIQDLKRSNWSEVRVCLANLSDVYAAMNRPAKQERIDLLALEIATVSNDSVGVFKSRLHRFRQLALVGASEATSMWSLLDSMGLAWPRTNYRPGEAEFAHALFRFWQAKLEEIDLVRVTQTAQKGNNQVEVRRAYELRGAWHFSRGEWAPAAASFDRAVTMARERRLVDSESETGLALAKHHLGQLTGGSARGEAERLAQMRQPAHRILAMLWGAIGNIEQATHHALAAYRWAWADGEPYVRRYELTKTTELLRQLNITLPDLPPYDPAKEEPFPWEADVRAELRSEKKAKKKKSN